MRMFKKRTTNQPRRRQTDAGSDRSDIAKRDNSTFQRNRTLMRGTSAYSYDSIDEVKKSPRSYVHHLASKRRKIGGVLISVVSASLIFFWLLTQFTAQVTVSISDSELSKSIDTKKYIDSINDYLGVHPLSRLRFALDKNDLAEYLLTVTPEVASVEKVSSGSIGDTDINLSMRRPIAGWTIGSTQYFVDEKGVSFERNYYDTPTLQIVDNSGISPQQGTTVASTRFLGFVGRVVALSKESSYVVEQAIIPVGTTRELEVQIKGIVPHVIFSIDRPVGEQVEDMVRALQYFTSRGGTPSYIDVRVSGKAFYQ